MIYFIKAIRNKFFIGHVTYTCSWYLYHESARLQYHNRAITTMAQAKKKQQKENAILIIAGEKSTGV